MTKKNIKITCNLVVELTFNELEDSNIVRTMLGRISEHNDNKMELRRITDGDGESYRFVEHDGNYGREFTFSTADDFIEKFTNGDSVTMQKVLSDYGLFKSFSTDKKEVEVEDDD